MEADNQVIIFLLFPTIFTTRARRREGRPRGFSVGSGFGHGTPCHYVLMNSCNSWSRVFLSVPRSWSRTGFVPLWFKRDSSLGPASPCFSQWRGRGMHVSPISVGDKIRGFILGARPCAPAIGVHTWLEMSAATRRLATALFSRHLLLLSGGPASPSFCRP